MISEGNVGPSNGNAADGAHGEIRLGRTGDQIVSELHGRFYEANYRGQLFGAGMTLTSINAATFTSATTGATATPIVGIYNPPGSQVNLGVQQATICVTMTALQATGGGPYVWMVASTTAQISTALQGWNRKSLTQTGGIGRNVSGVALTGLTGTLAIMGASGLGGGSASNAAFLGTAVAMQNQLMSFTENIDGAIIVPPGYVLALMATTTPVAHSAASNITWLEFPL